MWLCGQYFNGETVDRIQAAIESEPEISRRALSRQVCEWLGWRSANGKLKEMSCRKALQALQALHRRGRITLPEQKRSYFFQRSKTGIKQDLPQGVKICCNLKELGKVEIAPITSRYRSVAGFVSLSWQRSALWSADSLPGP
jgi:hypothetical protein